MATKVEINLDRVVRKAISYIPVESDDEGVVEDFTAFLQSVSSDIVETLDTEAIVKDLEQQLAEEIAVDLSKMLSEQLAEVRKELT